MPRKSVPSRKEPLLQKEDTEDQFKQVYNSRYNFDLGYTDFELPYIVLNTE